MKVLGILGSPRRGGNSEILLDKTLAGAQSAGRETEKIILNELDYRPCQGCRGCDKDGICVVKDDMEKVYQKADEADALILASPIFFGSLSAQVKMMIDRYQCRWVAKNVLKRPAGGSRPGLFLAVEASKREDFFVNARSIVKNFFATIGVAYSGELFCSGIEAKGDISKHPDLLDKAFTLGKKLL